jgi:hypothetical protein
MQYPVTCQNISYGAQCISRIPQGNIIGALNSFGHEQYPFDSLDQNNSAHGVYSVTQWGYWDLSRFW